MIIIYYYFSININLSLLNIPNYYYLFFGYSLITISLSINSDHINFMERYSYNIFLRNLLTITYPIVELCHFMIYFSLLNKKFNIINF